MKSDCIFCKIIRGELPSTKIFENEAVLGFADAFPQAPIHYLFVPKMHVESLADYDFKETSAIQSVIENLYKALLQTVEKKGLKSKGFRTVINTGSHGGQTVSHLHLHLISGPKLTPRFG